ncbi:hypothetical protein, partial [Aphanothece microscopica]|uniref:hypothetical protein n=1 Tax=Aphanothece microscopica TaxID=1049561 RepID=UPI0039851001
MTTTLGGADLSGGAHRVDAVRITAAGGPTGLASQRDLSVLGVATAADGRVGAASFSGRALSLDGAVRGDVVQLAATGAAAPITQAAPLDAGRLSLRSQGGDVTLARADNAIDHLAFADLGAGGRLALVTANRLSL